MDNPSRRNVLVTGSALGAVGALTAATPAQASALWTWSPKGSVAGAGAGADPRTVWDDEADPIVARIIQRGETADVNRLLKTWTKNGQALPGGLPAELRAFMEEARKLPSWADQKKLDAASTFNDRRGIYTGVLYGFASGMMSTVIPREARAVYYSQGGADMKDRIAKTAKLGYDIGTKDPYGPNGEMIVTCVKTRLAHAGVRHILPKSSHWDRVADEPIPISQHDMMVTWHSLPTTVMRELREWKVPLTTAETTAFLHSWQVCAHMLGIKDEYIPASWAEAESQAEQVLDPVLAPTPEGIKLADILINLGAELDGAILSKPILRALTRYVLGDEIADWLKLPREPFWGGLLETFWPPFIAVREGLLRVFPGTKDLYWLFEEIIRKVLLIYLGEAQKISIEIPDTNNPNYP